MGEPSIEACRVTGHFICKVCGSGSTNKETYVRLDTCDAAGKDSQVTIWCETCADVIGNELVSLI